MTKKFFVLLICSMALTGCASSKQENTQKQEFVREESSLINSPEMMNYKYHVKLTGKSNNAKQKSYYTVLTNDKSLTFETVDRKFWSSSIEDKNDFYIVAHGIAE